MKEKDIKNKLLVIGIILIGLAGICAIDVVSTNNAEDTASYKVTDKVTYSNVTPTYYGTTQYQTSKFSEFCGYSTYGACDADSDCMTGGCSGQVCQSRFEDPVITTCEWRDCYNADKYDVSCGCVEGMCKWKSKIPRKEELDIEITSPRDGETVSGVVRVEATATGPNKLDDMYLTIAGEHVAGHLKLTDCILGVSECEEGFECKPTYTKTCWYNWDTSGWKGERVTLTASISDVEGNKDEDSVVVYVSEERELRCGDVNCDGKVNMGDVGLLHNYVSYPGKYEICSEWAADVTCDGKIDMGDVILLQNHVTYPENDRYSLRCCREPRRDLVDVDVYPEIQVVELGDLAKYKITITDNHPIARCGIALADNPIPTATEIAVAETPTATATNDITSGGVSKDTSESVSSKDISSRCIVYYTYDLKVTGLPFDVEYPEHVTVYQGSSKTVFLTLKPTYRDKFKFTVKATLSTNANVWDSDSATLVVDEYGDCNRKCRSRGYDYGVCRTSCRENEYDIGTRYCPQIIANADATGGVEADTDMSYIDADIYWYPTYHCCCGNEGIAVKAWPGKRSYEPGETATIYAKVYSTENGDVDAKVTGTIERPDGKSDELIFRKICAIAEIQKIKDENPGAEISCLGDRCWPQCLYIATYKDTELGGWYDIEVKAKSNYGSAETTTGFWIREEVKTCNSYCQGIGYDYGVCRLSCRSGEFNAGGDYCPQVVSNEVISADMTENVVEITRYPFYFCCCGTLTPPPPPPEEKVKIELHSGWNLISLPGKGELSKGTCTEIYSFVYLDGTYVTMKEAAEILGEDALREYLRKHAFWTYSFKACSLEFKLEEPTSYTELELSTGWNFVPITRDMVGRKLSDIQGDCELQRVYLWDPMRQNWKNFGLNEEIGEEYKFKGFVTKVASACSLGNEILPPPALPGY